MKTFWQALFILALCSPQALIAQRYFKIENNLVDETALKKGLALMAREYNPQIVTYKTFERVMAQDSIIENIAIVIIKEEEEQEVYRVFDFLEKPLPDFEFRDQRGMAVAKQNFLGKYTVVGLYKSPDQLRKAHIRSLNTLMETGEYNTVVLIAKSGNRSAVAKRANFPILDGCISWYIENISIPEDPKFLVLDEDGKLRYIFQQFPDEHSPVKPIDSVHLTIFDLLK